MLRSGAMDDDDLEDDLDDDDPDKHIQKLQKALARSHVKTQAQATALVHLRQDVSDLQAQLRDERQAHKRMCDKKNITKLQNDLVLERTQRLSDLKRLQNQKHQVHALEHETSVATSHALESQTEAMARRTEILCLEKTLDVSTRLGHRADLNAKSLHKELEDTKCQLVDARSKHAQKSKEVHEWIDRYHQVMVDLHVAQMKLVQLSTTSSEKQAALERGHAWVLSGTKGVSPSSLVPETLDQVKPRPTNVAKHNGSRDDRAFFVEQSKRSAAARRGLNNHTMVCSSHNIAEPAMKVEKKSTKAVGRKTSSKKQREHGVHQSDSIRSKYLGYGLGMLKKDPMKT